MTDERSMIRVGIVSSVEGTRARVYFPDQGNMVSGWLYITRQCTWTPAVNDRVLCVYPYGEDPDGYILGVIS